MRRRVLFAVLLLAIVGTSAVFWLRKSEYQAAPRVVVEANPHAVVVAEPKPEAPRPRIVLTGDPNDPVFAGKKFSEWHAVLRATKVVPANDGGPACPPGAGWTALRVMELYGARAAPAVPEILRLADPADGDVLVRWVQALYYPNYWKDELTLTRNILSRFNSSSRLAQRPPDLVALIRGIGPAAYPQVAAALTSPDQAVRFRAAHLIVTLGLDTAEIGAAVTCALYHPDRDILHLALGLAEQVGPRIRPVSGRLTELLADQDEWTRRLAAFALSKVDPTVDDAIPVLVLAGRKSVDADRCDSTRLKRFGKRAIPFLMSVIRNPDRRDWDQAALLLSKLGADAAEAVPDLVRLMEAKEPEKRHYTLTAFTLLGVVARDAGPQLLQLAKTGVPMKPLDQFFEQYEPLEWRTLESRAAAARAAAAVGVSAADLVPVLEELAGLAGKWESRNEVHQKILQTLYFLGRSAGERGERLARGILAKRTTDLAMLVLTINPGSADALRIVFEEADREMSTTGQCRNLLNRVPLTAELLRPLLKHPTPGVRERAAARLLSIDPTDVEAASLLKEAAAWKWSWDTEFRRQGPFAAFARIGHAGVPHLVELLSSRDHAVRALAAVTLARLAPGDPDVVEAAGRMLAWDVDWKFQGAWTNSISDYIKSRLGLLSILAQAGPTAKQWSSTIRELLTEKQPMRVRLAAIEALAAIDPAAKEPVEVLTVLLRPENVRKADQEEWHHHALLFPPWPKEKFEEYVVDQRVANFRADVADALFRIDPAAAVQARVFDTLHKLGAGP